VTMTDVAAEKGADNQALNLEQEVDLLEYLNAVLRAKYRLVIVAMLAAAAVFGYSKMLDEKYTATALVALNIQQETGGLKAGDYRGSDLLALMEHDLVVQYAADNERERLIARMGSTHYLDHFISKYDLLPVIFYKNWNTETKAWKDGFEPNKAEAIDGFRKGIISVELDQKTGMLLISATAPHPRIAADIVNNFYTTFNEYMLTRSLSELRERAKVLDNRLVDEASLEIKRSIYRMQEMHLAEETFLLAKTDYPLEVIEVAQVPFFKSYPKRKVWTIVTLVLTLFLGVFVVLASVVLRKLTKALKSYHAPSGKQNGEHPAEMQSALLIEREPETATTSSASPIEEEPAKAKTKEINATPKLDELSEWIDKP